MNDNWFNHNTDKLILLVLAVGLWTSCILAAMHIFHHDADSMEAVAFISFMTGSVSTVLGALILILTGRTMRADGQTGSGLPPNMPASPPAPAAPLTTPPASTVAPPAVEAPKAGV